MLCFKFVNNDFESPGYYPALDYGKDWPKVLEVKADPIWKGQCAAGIHVIPLVDGADLTNVLFSDKIVILDVEDSDIVYREDFGKMRVSRAVVLGEPSVEQRTQIKDICLSSPRFAYGYAYFHQKHACDESRAVVLNDPEYAFKYAMLVDKASRKDTRDASCKDAKYAYLYALQVDFKPCYETRRAVLGDPQYSYFYALDVDKCAREDTQHAAYQDERFFHLYRQRVCGFSSVDAIE